MLSILIPTFNYNATPLVENLWNQIKLENIPFEILVLDDGSHSFLVENEMINSFENCRLIKNESNLGRSKTRNLLINFSQYNWILFLDGDTFPTNNCFLKKYIEAIYTNNKICFGGIEYKKEKPKTDQVLRWEYGSKREQISVNKRIQNPYKYALVSNILIEKSIFKNNRFNENITNYGYEDVEFIQQIELKNQTITHIFNTVYHLNYESSQLFIDKTKISLTNLNYLDKNEILLDNSIKIEKTFQLINRFNLKKVMHYLFKKTEKLLVKNLLSNQPSLLLFDVYRFGYYCSLK